jgi:hypothetical protein
MPKLHDRPSGDTADTFIGRAQDIAANVRLGRGDTLLNAVARSKHRSAAGAFAAPRNRPRYQLIRDHFRHGVPIVSRRASRAPDAHVQSHSWPLPNVARESGNGGIQFASNSYQPKE